MARLKWTSKKHIAKAIFPWIWCGKYGFYFFLNTINPLLRSLIKSSNEINQDKMTTVEARIRTIEGVDLYDPVKAAMMCLVPNVVVLKKLSSWIHQMHRNTMPHYPSQILLQQNDRDNTWWEAINACFPRWFEWGGIELVYETRQHQDP